MQVQHPTAPTRIIPENPVHAWADGYRAAQREPWHRLKARLLNAISIESILWTLLIALLVVGPFAVALVRAISTP